nr:helix-turn-helix transcriptional regulator [uncultured Desulfobulbus sp.]
MGQKVHLAAIRDVTERKLIEAKLHEKQDHLGEANAALRALLRQRELDRQDFEEAVEKNMKHFILPYLEYLKTSSLNPAQENWINLLELHLAQITSSFAHKLTLAELNFSNAELKVASLVREGKTSKEIAQQLMIAEKTVSAHRGNIRKKLGLKGKKGGLRYLLLNLR